MELLRHEPGNEPAPDGVVEPREATRASRRRYVCRACGAHVGDVGDEVAVDGLTHHERVNPGAFVHRFVTLARANEVRSVSEATSEFTWFVGYAWRLAACGGCNAHLGWRFESEGVRSPAAFWGVRLDQIREDDASGSSRDAS